MLFATFIEYTPDTAKIAATRPAHREYLKGLFETNRLAISGPFTDDKAGLLVYNAETVEDVEAMLSADPFAKQGVFVNLGPHPPRLWPEDVDLLHQIWLELCENSDCGSRLHHRDVVGVALKRLQRDLTGDRRTDAVDEVRRDIRKA